jgi:hypothetical protein
LRALLTVACARCVLLPHLAGNERLLDPTTPTLNATVPAGAADSFNALWSEVSLAREARRADAVASGRKGARPHLRATSLSTSASWSSLSASQLRVAPVTATSCGSVDTCVGYAEATGACICSA